MHIKVLGPGCRNCQALERITRDALAELHIEAELDKVTDYVTIAGYGVIRAPALVVDDELVVSGRVPNLAQVRDLLATRASAV